MGFIYVCVCVCVCVCFYFMHLNKFFCEGVHGTKKCKNSCYSGKEVLNKTYIIFTLLYNSVNTT